MKIKRIHFFLGLLGLSLCLIPFRYRLRNFAMGLLNLSKDRKTVADRVKEFGDAVHTRLAPHFTDIGIQYPPRRIVLLGLKEERLLEVWVDDGQSALKHLKAYPILAASGHAGPKLAEGDLQVPEGIYKIESLNPNSSFHLSLRVGYPNAFDLEKARLEGRTNPGSDIMIHGKAASIGCLAVGDPAAEELFVLAAETGIENVKLILSPIDFRRRTMASIPETAPKWTSELYATIQSEMEPLKGN